MTALPKNTAEISHRAGMSRRSPNRFPDGFVFMPLPLDLPMASFFRFPAAEPAHDSDGFVSPFPQPGTAPTRMASFFRPAPKSVSPFRWLRFSISPPAGDLAQPLASFFSPRNRPAASMGSFFRRLRTSAATSPRGFVFTACPQPPETPRITVSGHPSRRQ